MFTKILVPIDFSPASRKALEIAMGLARKLGSEIALLHVCAIPDPPIGVDASMIGAADTFEHLLKARLAHARTELETWRAQFAGQGVTLSHTVTEGIPFERVVEAAKEQKADLIVMGTQGKTGLKRLMVGSTAERVVRFAAVPVMTVHDA